MNRRSPTFLPDATAAERSSFRKALLKWFDAHQRDLPWRKNRSLYRVWVSEIMLQQTQVATVIDYYRRFMKRFPTVKKLAAADQSEVLKLWEGLGYYRRARQLHKAAGVIVEEHGGRFPDAFEEVLALPGIGRYTAGAILSIALDQRHPVLEGNTIRLFARLMQMKSDPKTSANQKLLWQFSESLLPRKRAGDFNQALMELGSEICIPKVPKCEGCPVIRFCPTFHGGLQNEIPAASKKMRYESLHEAVVLVSKKTGKQKRRYLVRWCDEGERWSGLWDFPRYQIDKGQSPESLLAGKIKSTFGLGIDAQSTGVRIKHAVTRFRIVLDVFQCKSPKGRLRQNPGHQIRWATREQLDDLPMNTTARKVVQRCCD